MSSYHTVYWTVPGRASGAGRAALHLKVKKSQKRPSGQQARAAQKMIIDARQRGRKLRFGSATCPVVFFRKKGGGTVAVQRCENSHRFKSTAFAAAARKRAKKLCRGAKNRFKRCR